MTATNILNLIEEKKATVGVLGLGYVGLPLAVEFAKVKLKTIGFDKNEAKVLRTNDGNNYIGDVSDDDLKAVIASKHLEATTDFSRIKECDAIIICVPTPLDKFKKPDMSFIESACKDIAKNMKGSTFISLESTTYPTTTENFVKPIIENLSGLKEGKDFWLCFSAERVDPGNKNYKTDNTPKVVGGLGEDAQTIGLALYGKCIRHLHPVSSPKIAEMTKILENTYRLVNISMINEMALLCGKMDINIWEVIDAAKTKPYGFQAFYPGPGIGGHCIPLDPFYLEYIAKQYQFDLTMIHTAGLINNLMPHRMTIKITSALNRHRKSINGSKILFLGAAYKADISDCRESPALAIIDEVVSKGGDVIIHEPYCEFIITDQNHRFNSVPLSDELLRQVDCVVITTRHSCFDLSRITGNAQLVVDLRNAVPQPSDKVYKL